MNRSALLVGVAIGIICLGGDVDSLVGGELSPPVGPVGPTMKTLVEIEPRIAINATNTPGDVNFTFRISQSGSYYLTGNMTGESGKTGIGVGADNVTIDLCGFAVVGVPGSGNGIGTTASLGNNLAVRNGTVRGWGSNGFIANSSNIYVERIRASDNGLDGISVGFNATVRDCVARLNAGNGFEGGGTVAFSGCSAMDNTLNGFSTGSRATVTNCTASSNDGVGFFLVSGSIATGCSSGTNVDDGFSMPSNNTGVIIVHCISQFNTGDGIEVTSDCRVSDNTCDSNGNGGDGAGIHVTGSDNRIDGNHVTDNDRGIDANPATGNLIIRNSASGNATAYDVAAGNAKAQVLTPGDDFVSTDPWANMSF